MPPHKSDFWDEGTNAMLQHKLSALLEDDEPLALWFVVDSGHQTTAKPMSYEKAVREWKRVWANSQNCVLRKAD